MKKVEHVICWKCVLQAPLWVYGQSSVQLSTVMASTKEEDFNECKLTIITHNVPFFTDKDKTKGAEFFEQRITNLANCYRKKPFDVLVLQEVASGEHGEAAVEKLAKRLGDKYAFKVSDKIDNTTCAAFIFNTNKLHFRDIHIGVPIARNSGLLKANRAKSLPSKVSGKCGFKDLSKHTYLRGQNILGNRCLFLHTPCYVRFRIIGSSEKKYLVVCNVHLASDPSNELEYMGDLLPDEPHSLWNDDKTLFVLCGDMNLTQSRKAIPDVKDGYKYVLEPPFDQYTTNLGTEFLKSENDHCYDNIIVPSFVQNMKRKILGPPNGFVEQLFQLSESERSGVSTRSKTHRPPEKLFSNHRAVAVSFTV